MKTPTHQATFGTHSDIVAWQFNKTAAIPPWVFKHFHFINGNWTARGNSGQVLTARQGDWIAWSVGEKKAFVLTDVEFKPLFRPLPLAG